LAFTRRRLAVTSLSTQIQQLESVLGVRIFERDRRRVLVTRVGADIVARARRAIVEVEGLIAAAAHLRDPFAGTVRIGVIPTVAPYLLPEVMPKVGAKYPKLALVFREERTAEIVRELADGTLDGGLLALEAEIGDCAHAEITKDSFVAALPKGHPLARKKRLEPSDLEGENVLLLDEGHCFRAQALAVCSEAKAKETPFRATSLTTLAQMVSSGAGITLLPSMAVPVENRRGQLEVRPFVKPVPGRTVALVWRRRSPLAAVFTELARAFRGAAT
jgi:LysR family hydrogen peroxide-inducible transcriptional activator